MMFSLIVPLLNTLLEQLSKRQLLSVCVAGIILCTIRFAFLGFANPFYINAIILWTIIYFCIAYLKRYKQNWISSPRFGGLCVAAGVTGYVGIIILANALGRNMEIFASSLTRWIDNGNVFVILTAIGLVILASNLHIKNKWINSISGLSLLVYVIHENVLLRTLYRPMMFEWLYDTYGSVNLMPWVWIFSVAIFVGSVLISYCYQKTICRLLLRVNDWLYPKLAFGWNQLINRLE